MHDIFPQVIFFENLPVWDWPDHIRSLGVHQVHVKILGPAVLLDKPAVGFSVIPHPGCRVAIGGVTLYNRAVDLLHHRSPELRMKEVLVSLLSGVNLHGNFPRQLDPQGPIQPDHALRCDFPGEIYLCFHTQTSQGIFPPFIDLSHPRRLLPCCPKQQGRFPARSPPP